MRGPSPEANSFIVLTVEAGRAKVRRFRIQTCGETLLTTEAGNLAARFTASRPHLVAVIGQREEAESLAEELRQQGLAESVFVVAPDAGGTPAAPGRVPVSFSEDVTEASPEKLLTTLLEAMVSAYARFPVSPLTGMPGSAVLRQEVEARLARTEPFAFLYLDLDNFKAYNDLYGFGRGDIVIRALASEVEAAIARHGTSNDLAVHVGGDDFAVITAPDRASRVARQIITEFKREVITLYPVEARTAGHIETLDRQGNPTRYPLMTVSVGGVDTSHRPVSGYLELTEIAAEMKVFAKSQQGGRFVMDRRRRWEASQSGAHSWKKVREERR